MTDDGFEYDGTVIRADGERLNLTDMWKAAGSPVGKPPGEWLRQSQAADLIEFATDTMGIAHSLLVQTKEGRGGGTWAYWQLGMAYAKILSPEFHFWCNSVIRDRMEGKLVPATAATLTEKDFERLTTKHAWLICKPCHRELTGGKLDRNVADIHFVSFQRRLDGILS